MTKQQRVRSKRNADGLNVFHLNHARRTENLDYAFLGAWRSWLHRRFSRKQFGGPCLFPTVYCACCRFGHGRRSFTVCGDTFGHSGAHGRSDLVQPATLLHFKKVLRIKKAP